MPDLMTHMTAAYLVKRAVSPRRHMLSFVAGATLPDLVSYVPLFAVGIGMSLQRIGLLQAPGLPPWLGRLPCLFAPFHGILPFFLLCWMAALFFPRESRRGVFLNLVLGAALHFVMDLGQVSHNPVGYLLYPLSHKSFSLEWFGSESSLVAAPVLAALAAAVLAHDGLRARRRKLKISGPRSDDTHD